MHLIFIGRDVAWREDEADSVAEDEVDSAAVGVANGVDSAFLIQPPCRWRTDDDDDDGEKEEEQSDFEYD